MSGRWGIILKQAALLMGFVVALSGPTWATTFIAASIDQLAAASGTIVIGQIETIQGHTSGGRIETVIGVRVEQALRGDPGSELTLVQPGGSVGDVRRWIFGAPTFFIGERILLFARRDSSGDWATTFLGMGKFQLVRSSAGVDFAVRNLDEGTVRNAVTGQVDAEAGRSRFLLSELISEILRAAPSRDAAVGPVARQATTGHWQANFTFTGPPGLRRFAAPGEPTDYLVDSSGDEALGPEASTAAVESALAAWSSPMCTSLQLRNAGPAEVAPFGACDHRSQILFNDPSSEIADGVDCVGVLAIGGVCADGTGTQVFNGSHFYPITEGDVVVNNGYGNCPFWNQGNVAEVITHELGHTLGFAHSSDDPNEPDLLLRSATMYYAAHFDGRGAALRTDDVAALCDLYPSGATGRVRLRQFAFVFAMNDRRNADRIVVDGELDFGERHFNPVSDPLIVNVRSSSIALASLSIRPSTWDVNPERTRFRVRRDFGAGRVTLTLSISPGSVWRFQITGRGLDLSKAKTDGVNISLATDGASASTSVELRTNPRSRIYP